MDGLDALAIGTVIIRLINAVAWTIIGIEVLQMDRPVPRLVRQLMVTVIVFGMWALMIGSLTQFGALVDVIRPLYTAFTAYAALIAIGILSSRILTK